MPEAARVPTLEDVQRIKEMADPLLRNLWITQCYYELSTVLSAKLGPSANWCTFASWASKQAGQTIRKEDLARLLERRLIQSRAAVDASRNVTAAIHIQPGDKTILPQNLALRADNFRPAVDRASDAVGRGNKKVFEEIGYEFARFYQNCFPDGDLDPTKVEQYCQELREGEPPDGQSYLRRAFSHYARAVGETDPKVKAELILLANIEIGFHEQTRLQPEIAESLDAGFVSFLDFAWSLFGAIFPLRGWFQLSHLYMMRLLRRPTELDLAIQAVLTEARTQLRQILTETMMSLAFPSGVIIRLGEDLGVGYPQSLQQIANPELIQFLQRHDPTPDSLGETSALDWADLPDRMHFILDLFRCYQEYPALFEPPFTTDQLAALQEGCKPQGRL